jgi:hypothetical protein
MNAMNRGMSLWAVGHATSVFLAITFTLCVGLDLLLPAHAMYQTWQRFLPGFPWISWGSFGVGLLESYGYGWYLALIWVPLYNVLADRPTRSDGRSAQNAA